MVASEEREWGYRNRTFELPDLVIRLHSFHYKDWEALDLKRLTLDIIICERDGETAQNVHETNDRPGKAGGIGSVKELCNKSM